MPIKLISTDFDGTIFSEFENPPISAKLQRLIGDLQQRGAKWVINTGRDMSSLMEALGRSGIEIEPDFLVLVEREIYLHHDSRYLALDPWNANCTNDHRALFEVVTPMLPDIIDWINERYHARIYEDPYSPFCLIASCNADMDAIHAHLNEFCRSVPDLTVVRNDIYSRFSHVGYSKGTALAELTRRLGLTSDQVFAAGDHLNDLPMLQRRYAQWLCAPANAIEPVRVQMQVEGGRISELAGGEGVAQVLESFLKEHKRR